jgi:uncharacterized membrane protein
MVRKLTAFLIGSAALVAAAPFAAACPRCESNLLARGIATQPPYLAWLAIAAIPVVIIAVVVAVVWRRAPLAAAGIMLGAGLGGFLDGILLHQLFQWHNMFSTVLPPIDLVSSKVNMVGDGVFHVLTWLSTVAAVTLLWKAATERQARLSTRELVASTAIGWGAFNLLEGVVDHQLLGIHHVHPGAGQLEWDIAFLASGAVMILAGYAAVRRDRITMHAHAPG